MLHAELVSSSATGTCDGDCDVRKHSTWADSRPPQFELDAARAIVATLRSVRDSHPELWNNATTWGQLDGRPPQLGAVPEGFKVHIAHLGTAAALPIYQEVCTSSDFEKCLLLGTFCSSWTKRCDHACRVWAHRLAQRVGAFCMNAMAYVFLMHDVHACRRLRRAFQSPWKRVHTISRSQMRMCPLGQRSSSVRRH